MERLERVRLAEQAEQKAQRRLEHLAAYNEKEACIMCIMPYHLGG